MPKILAVQANEQGEAEVVLVCAPAEIGMRAVRIDEGPRVVLARAEAYPPAAGQWHRHDTGGPLTLCCGKCGKQSGVACPPNQVHADGRIEPEWLCPHCGARDMVQLADFAPVRPGACPTCSHDFHAQPCAAPRGAVACGCHDDGDEHRPVYRLEPAVSLKAGRVVLPSELNREAKVIAAEAMRHARVR